MKDEEDGEVGSVWIFGSCGGTRRIRGKTTETSAHQRDGFKEIREEQRDGFSEIRGEWRDGIQKIRGGHRDGFSKVCEEQRDGFSNFRGGNVTFSV